MSIEVVTVTAFQTSDGATYLTLEQAEAAQKKLDYKTYIDSLVKHTKEEVIQKTNPVYLDQSRYFKVVFDPEAEGIIFTKNAEVTAEEIAVHILGLKKSLDKSDIESIKSLYDSLPASIRYLLLRFWDKHTEEEFYIIEPLVEAMDVRKEKLSIYCEELKTK